MGLPIEWYYEWIILAVIGYIAYLIAYEKVGSLYHGDLISGRAAGSFCHWIIRTLYFIVMWAIAYGVIWIGTGKSAPVTAQQQSCQYAEYIAQMECGLLGTHGNVDLEESKSDIAQSC